MLTLLAVKPVGSTPRIHSAWIFRSCCRVVWSIGNHPVRTDLDKGGRSYGSHGSSPISVRCPVKPSLRSASPTLKPAREAPTITTRSTGTRLVVTDLLLVIIHLLGCRRACLSLVVRQPGQYLWPEPGMRPLPARPVHVIRRRGCSRIRAIAPRENGTLLRGKRHIVHTLDTGSNQLRFYVKPLPGCLEIGIPYLGFVIVIILHRQQNSYLTNTVFNTLKRLCSKESTLEWGNL